MRKPAVSVLPVLLLLVSCASPSREEVDGSVSIGTHRLHIYCLGAGTPAIVIDVGAGESYHSWELIQEELAQDTRVCTYDRAGYGQSEPGPMPRDSRREAAELHRLLQSAGEEGPFLLVGHSLGGLNMQLFAADYPEQTVGLVLLDPPPEAWMMGERFPELSELFHQATSEMRATAASASASSDPEEKAQAAFLEAVASEHEQLFAQSAQQVAAIDSFGRLPLTVVGAAQPDPRFGEQSSAFREFWNDELRKLAAKSERGRFILAEGSSHHIHLDAPQLVLDAIREMLAQYQP